MLSYLPFNNQNDVPNFIERRPDIIKPEKLKSFEVKVTSNLTFSDRLLPHTDRMFREHTKFSKQYFVELHNFVKSFGVHNYRGARIPLAHNNINVATFRDYLIKFKYPQIHIMQFVEFGFPLGLWSEAYLEPTTRNHSSAYSHYSFVDKFIEVELEKLGMTGPFDASPWDFVMVSPMMTAHKKPDSRRPVFDASFGLYSLNKNTPQNSYHDLEYEFSFPKVDNLADRIATLGKNCYLWKRDLSRFYLQLKVDPFEYDRLGFIWRGKLFLFVSFVWGCRHAGYCGQWLTTAVAFILANLGVECSGEPYYVLNYADDFCGAESCKTKSEAAFAALGKLLTSIGLTESIDKASSPCTKMTYLGVLFDTTTMCMYVDHDKVTELKIELSKWIRKTVASKSELQSILGKLLWVSRTVRYSRVFVSRIIAETRKLTKQSEKTRLSQAIRKDFLWWDRFMTIFSGVEIIPSVVATIAVLGDAYPQGGGAWNTNTDEYFSLRFPQYFCSPDIPIHVKEFLVVLFSVRMWGPKWSGEKIKIYCDNDAVCDTIMHQKPKDPTLQQLLREFLFWVCSFNFHPIIEKISTKGNHVADFISRNHDSEDIDNYFESCGLPKQTRLHVSLDWFKYHADW